MRLDISMGILILLAASVSMAFSGQVIIGAVEEVLLLPWGVKLPARIDTGAAKSSLAARGLKVKDNMVEFRLPEKHGGKTIRLPLVKWVEVRTNEGLERRALVEMEVCIGARQIRTQVNLDERSGLKFPVLIGRNTLEGNFLVDVKQSRTQTPGCKVERRP